MKETVLCVHPDTLRGHGISGPGGMALFAVALLSVRSATICDESAYRKGTNACANDEKRCFGVLAGAFGRDARQAALCAEAPGAPCVDLFTCIRT
jgi:hypothetical protein